MPILTWILTQKSASIHQELSESLTDGSGPTLGNIAPIVGWTPGTSSLNTVSSLDSNIFKASLTFTTQSPATFSIDVIGGNCFRTTNPYMGSFSSGSWKVYHALEAHDPNADQSVAIITNLWRDKSPSGSTATQLNTLIASGTNNVAGGAATASVTNVTSSIGINTFYVDNEYIFVQVGALVGQKSTSQLNAVLYKSGALGTKLISPNFIPAGGQFWPI